MARITTLVALAALELGACTADAPAVSTAYDVCHAYGFSVGSAEYRLCREREASTRPLEQASLVGR